MTDIPSPLTYATITGRFVSIMADSNDDGSAPDLVTMSGTVTITPSIRRIHIIGADDGSGSEIAIAQTINATVVNGQLLGPDGVSALNILATDSPGINPTAFQYTASFSLTGAAVQPATITFNAPGGTVVDLSSVIPADSAPAVQTVVSDATRIAAQASADAAAASAAAAEAAAESATGLPTGGTTGQVLAKNSNANSDVHWVSQIGSVTSVAGKTGVVTLAESDISGLTSDLAALAVDSAVAHLTGAETIAGVKTFSSPPVVPTQTAGDNTTKVASTAFVKAAIDALVAGAPGALDTLNEIATQLATDESAASALTTSVGLKAPLASPALTGSPTAPTPSSGDNDTSIATTAFVHSEAVLQTAALIYTRRYASGAWPVRGTVPSNSIVEWVGPTPPPIDGTYALTGVDLYSATVS